MAWGRLQAFEITEAGRYGEHAVVEAADSSALTARECPYQHGHSTFSFWTSLISPMLSFDMHASWSFMELQDACGSRLDPKALIRRTPTTVIGQVEIVLRHWRFCGVGDLASGARSYYSPVFME